MMKLQILKPNDLKNMRMILATSQSETRVSMLQILQHSPGMTYSVLASILTSLSYKTLAGNRMAYHLKILKRASLITLSCDGKYSISTKGSHLLEILKQSQEKFLTDNQDAICNNQKENIHDFITVCRNCGVVV